MAVAGALRRMIATRPQQRSEPFPPPKSPGLTAGSGSGSGGDDGRAMPLELSRREKVALIALLSGLIESDPFPEPERVQELRRILAKLRADMKAKPSELGERRLDRPQSRRQREAVGSISVSTHG